MIADIRPGAVNDQLNAATVYQLYELNILVGTVLPGELDDRCLHVDAKSLVVGNCVASLVLDPVSNAQVIVCCFQVIFKAETFMLLFRSTQHPAVPQVVRYDYTGDSKVVAFHSLGVIYMTEKPHLFKFQNNDDTVIRGVIIRGAETMSNSTLSVTSTGSSSLSITESAARIAAKHLNFVILGNVDRLRVLALESKASQSVTVPAILAGIVADHPLLGTKAVYPNIMMQVATRSKIEVR